MSVIVAIKIAEPEQGTAPWGTGIGIEVEGERWAEHSPVYVNCQSALDRDPLSASERDPFERRVRPVALALSELAGVAETERARA